MGSTSEGYAAVLFVLAALFWPGPTLFVLIFFFGAYVLVDGIFALLAGIRGSEGRRWLLLAEGGLGILAGLTTFVWPGITALAQRVRTIPSPLLVFCNLPAKRGVLVSDAGFKPATRGLEGLQQCS